MLGKSRKSDLTAAFTAYRYIGPGYVVGIPARDLTEADLVAIEKREHITREHVEASGIYEPVAFIEVHPFCGAPTDWGRCRALVDEWGQRCPDHMEATDDTPSI